MAVMTFAQWLKAYQRTAKGKNAKDSKATRALYETWKRNATSRDNTPTDANNDGQEDRSNLPMRVVDPNWTASDNTALTDQIARLQGQRTGLVTTGNSDRRQAATTFQRQMADAGYFMPEAQSGQEYFTSKTEANTAGTGDNITYSFQPGLASAEGALYRQTAMQNLSNMARAGMAGSSRERNAWRNSYNTLNQKRAAALGEFDANQRQSVTTQNAADGALNDQISGLQAQNLAYRAGQTPGMVDNPALTTRPPATSAPTAGTTVTSTTGQVIRRPTVATGSAWDARNGYNGPGAGRGANTRAYSFAPNTKELDRQFQGRPYRVRRQGNQWIVSW